MIKQNDQMQKMAESKKSEVSEMAKGEHLKKEKDRKKELQAEIEKKKK
jgi:hypothetical protein